MSVAIDSKLHMNLHSEYFVCDNCCISSSIYILIMAVYLFSLWQLFLIQDGGQIPCQY